jgi:hypothetical protein
MGNLSLVDKGWGTRDSSLLDMPFIVAVIGVLASGMAYKTAKVTRKKT